MSASIGIKPPYSTKKDLENTMRIINVIMVYKKLTFTEDVIKRIAVNIMNISYSIGGDYSEKTIELLSKSYFDNELYKKLI